MERTSAAVERLLGEPGVTGRIEVVTTRPIVLRRQDGILARMEALVQRRPWLITGAFLGAVALLLLDPGD